MAESAYAEKLNHETALALSDISTGDDAKGRQLYPQLSDCFLRAKKIDIIVAFLRESGVRMIMKDLKNAVERGAQVRILTGSYLGITQPSALYLLKKEFGDTIELRFYNEPERSFHPKSYIIHYGDYSDIFIGSSNISRSALTSGIEWNYRFSSRKDPDNYQKFYDTFVDLYEHHSLVVDDEELKRYSKNWHQPEAIVKLDRYEEYEDKHTRVYMMYEPRGAQIEALYALENTRAEGASKALIMAATGIGKTYLAAFDSKNFRHVLFVAHREEILKQAAQSFKNVRLSDDYGFFNGNDKCTDKSVIFASVASLGRKEYLTGQYFSRDYFDYIVIDEFHHAVNKQYLRIIDYFKPKFMLGLTATPDRMDGRSIYELCDYNVPYEIDLKEGINKGFLVPFHYYGIYDDTDYSALHLVRGHYDAKELNETYIGNVQRHDLIYKYYCKYGSKQALGFCCSRAHAEEMAAEFSRRGIPSAAVYSNSDGEYSEERSAAVEKLKNGEIRVIFSVDMFNEGVDITSVDMVMFLRPTESPVVFMQQLGRGLRKSTGKTYLNVLDFIGNYEKAGRVRFLLTGREISRGEYQYAKQDDFPDKCLIDFDMRLIDLFHEMDQKHVKVKELIQNEYFRVKSELEKRPSRVELFTYMDDEVYKMALSRSKDNPFKNYLGFLKNLNELNNDENMLLESLAKDFLSLIENTSMTKVYKMPVLMAFYNGGDVRMNVSEQDLLKSWKEFFDQNGNWKDLETAITYEEYKNIKDSAHISKILKMPVHFLEKSGEGFFVKTPGYALSLRKELESVVKSDAFAEQMNDIIEYRTLNYYQRRYQDKKL